VDFRGKLILDAPDHVFTNPNGHGGVLSALIDTGMLAELKGRGVTELFHFQVDNVLAVIADPVFLGLHHEARAGMSCKVARKRDPIEKVGVAVKRADGRVCVVEYSDLDEKLARRTEPDGSLSFWAGSLAMHCYSVEFVESAGVSGRLTFHLARKKVPCVDEGGNPVEPAEPNGIKFETFVFDALPMCERVAVMEIERADEFAPVKNKTGEDSIDTARAAMVDLWSRWLESAGVRILRDASGRPVHPVEISPLYALDADELKRKVPRDLAVTGPLVLENT
jgi:UDP-N-acetylglucosamine/UDP-N-acetylgalactosamine diphosphorylase